MSNYNRLEEVSGIAWPAAMALKGGNNKKKAPRDETGTRMFHINHRFSSKLKADAVVAETSRDISGDARSHFIPRRVMGRALVERRNGQFGGSGKRGVPTGYSDM